MHRIILTKSPPHQREEFPTWSFCMMTSHRWSFLIGFVCVDNGDIHVGLFCGALSTCVLHPYRSDHFWLIAIDVFLYAASPLASCINSTNAKVSLLPPPLPKPRESRIRLRTGYFSPHPRLHRTIVGELVVPVYNWMWTFRRSRPLHE